MEKSKYQIKYEEFVNALNQPEKFIASIRKVHKDFIASNDECNANMAFGTSFRMDDADAYIQFLEKAEGYEGNILQQIYAVQGFVDEYFGIGRDEIQRQSLNRSLGDLHSIRDYKGKNVAMCFERAVLAHNLFKLVGVNSSLIMNDKHAYNILQTQKSVVVFDVTNFINYVENGIKKYAPAFIVMPKADVEEFLYGDMTLELNDKAVKQLFPNATNIDVPAVKYKGLNLEKTETKTEELSV